MHIIKYLALTTPAYLSLGCASYSSQQLQQMGSTKARVARTGLDIFSFWLILNKCLWEAPFRWYKRVCIIWSCEDLISLDVFVQAHTLANKKSDPKKVFYVVKL